MRVGRSHVTTSLECDLLDASLMARLAFEFVERGLEAENGKPLRLNEQDSELLRFAVKLTCLSIEEANEAFHKQAEYDVRLRGGQ